MKEFLTRKLGTMIKKMKCDFCDRQALRVFTTADIEQIRHSCGGSRHDELCRELFRRDGFKEWTEKITAPFYGNEMSYEIRRSAKNN